MFSVCSPALWWPSCLEDWLGFDWLGFKEDKSPVLQRSDAVERRVPNMSTASGALPKCTENYNNRNHTTCHETCIARLMFI